MTMTELFQALERVSGVKAPTRWVPVPLLYAIAGVSELLARTTGKPALLSLATVKLMRQEDDHSCFDPTRSERELGLRFRPVEQTLADEIAWFRANGMLPPAGAGTTARSGVARSLA